MNNKLKGGQGIAIGIAMGTLVGVLTNNIGLWLPIGVAIGAGISLTSGQKEKQ